MIELDRLRISLKGFRVEDVSLSVAEGEFFMLLGPTGAGKTLLLEAITGTGPVTEGRILIRGRDITDLPPERRGVGIVYQDYALFPHLTARQNIVYGLKYHRGATRDPGKWVDRLVERLGLSALVDRSVQTLSGGERQRIALARALAVQPSVLLLDEPLSALDPNFSEEIRHMLKDLHRDVGITFLMVTHDFADALFLGERAAVLNRGRVEQVGKVSEVFRKPANPFVARFVGMKNVFPARFTGARARVDGVELGLPEVPCGNPTHVAIRAEDVGIDAKDTAHEPDRTVLTGTLENVVDRGLFFELSIRTGSMLLTSMITRGEFLRGGVAGTRDVRVAVRNSDVHVL